MIYFGVKYLSFYVCLFVFKAIGAEYGEGFETFRQDGPLKVDVVSNFSDY